MQHRELWDIHYYDIYFRYFWSGKKNLSIGDYVHLHSGRAEVEET